MASAHDTSAQDPSAQDPLSEELKKIFKNPATCTKLTDALHKVDVDTFGDLSLLSEKEFSDALAAVKIDDAPLSAIIIKKLNEAVVPFRKPKTFATIAAAPPSAGGGSARPPVMRPADGSAPVKSSGKAAQWPWFKRNQFDKFDRPLTLPCTAAARGPSYVSKVLGDEGVAVVTFPVTIANSAEIDRFHVRVSITEEITALLVPLMGHADYDEWALEAKITKPRT